jgi:hypothetical protein
MLKRVAAASLWILATWVGYEIIWSITEVPRIIGPLLAGAVALIVMVDPLRVFWPVRSERRSDRSVETVPSFDASLAAPR